MFAPGLVFLALLVAVFLEPMVPHGSRRRGRAPLPFPVATAAAAVAIASVHFLLPDGPLRSGLWPTHPTALSLFTYAFVHSDLLHLAANLAALVLLGPVVEGALGPARFLAAYLGAGVAAGLAHVAAAHLTATADLPLVGASGAIFGLLGLFAVRFWRHRIRLFGVVPMTASIAVSIVMLVQALFLFATRRADVAYSAHLGGALFGIALAFPLRLREAGRDAYDREDAQTAARNGQWELAAAHYRNLVARQPDDPALRHALASVCLRLGQDEAAGRHFSRALSGYVAAHDPESAIHAFEEARSASLPLDLEAPALLAAATACEDAGRDTLAMHALSEVCRRFPDLSEAQSAQLRLARLHLRKLHQPRNAVALLTEFVRAHPTSPFLDHARALLTEAERTAHWSGTATGSDSPCC